MQDTVDKKRKVVKGERDGGQKEGWLEGGYMYRIAGSSMEERLPNSFSLKNVLRNNPITR